MPKRPRSHQLEDESRLAFRRALPAAWVFRDSIPDYGIDGEVELFDDDSNGTGRLFKVQLKATNEPDLNRALSIRFRLDTVRYYRSLGLPVLIVRYHRPTQKLYHQWFHTFDPYYSKGGKKTMTFCLSPECEWSSDTPEALASQLEAIRRVRSPEISLPVEFSVTTTCPELNGVSSAKIISTIRSEASRLPGVLKISGVKPSHVVPSITIALDSIVVDLVGGTSMTLHAANSNRRLTPDTLSRLPGNVFVLVALALARAGHSNIAARIATEYVPHSSIVAEPTIAIAVVQCMVRAQRVTEALDLSEKLFDLQESRMLAQSLILPALIHSGSLSSSEREFVCRYLKKRIERAEQIGDRQSFAVAHYNLGNFIRRRELRTALYHYRKAAEYDSGYLERPYFWKELAGILFGCRRYRVASRFYERAKQLGEQGECQALLADSLLFSGRFREALEAFHTYFETATDPDPEWRLKSRVLHVLQEKLGFDEQKREPATALGLASKAVTFSVEKRLQQLLEALNRDALCNLAWFNLGILENQMQNTEAAFFAFLAAALIAVHDVEAWSNAVLLGMSNEHHQPLVPDIIRVAYRHNGEKLLARLIAQAEAQLGNSARVSEFSNILNEIMNSLPRRESTIDLRIVGEGVDYHTIPIQSSNRET